MNCISLAGLDSRSRKLLRKCKGVKVKLKRLAKRTIDRATRLGKRYVPCIDLTSPDETPFSGAIDFFDPLPHSVFQNVTPIPLIFPTQYISNSPSEPKNGSLPSAMRDPLCIDEDITKNYIPHLSSLGCSVKMSETTSARTSSECQISTLKGSSPMLNTSSGGAKRPNSLSLPVVSVKKLKLENNDENTDSVPPCVPTERDCIEVIDLLSSDDEDPNNCATESSKNGFSHWSPFKFPFANDASRRNLVINGNNLSSVYVHNHYSHSHPKPDHHISFSPHHNSILVGKTLKKNVSHEIKKCSVPMFNCFPFHHSSERARLNRTPGDDNRGRRSCRSPLLPSNNNQQVSNFGGATAPVASAAALFGEYNQRSQFFYNFAKKVNKGLSFLQDILESSLNSVLSTKKKEGYEEESETDDVSSLEDELQSSNSNHKKVKRRRSHLKERLKKIKKRCEVERLLSDEWKIADKNHRTALLLAAQLAGDKVLTRTSIKNNLPFSMEEVEESENHFNQPLREDGELEQLRKRQRTDYDNSEIIVDDEISFKKMPHNFTDENANTSLAFTNSDVLKQDTITGIDKNLFYSDNSTKNRHPSIFHNTSMDPHSSSFDRMGKKRFKYLLLNDNKHSCKRNDTVNNDVTNSKMEYKKHGTLANISNSINNNNNKVKRSRLSRELRNLANDECKELRDLGFHPTHILGNSDGLDDNDNYLFDDPLSYSTPTISPSSSPKVNQNSLLSYKKNSSPKKTDTYTGQDIVKQMIESDNKLSRELSKLMTDEWKELKKSGSHPSQLLGLLSNERSLRSFNSISTNSSSQNQGNNAKRTLHYDTGDWSLSRSTRGQNKVPVVVMETMRQTHRNLIQSEEAMCIVNYDIVFN